MMRMWIATFFLSVPFFWFPFSAQAAQLRSLTDKISTSVPASQAGHVIDFVNTNDIPEGGEVRVRFEGNGAPFIFPPLFDYTNVGVSVSRGSGFEQFIIDAISDTATSSVNFYPIGDGEIRVRIASDPSFYIPAGSTFRISIGAGVTDPSAVLNPSVQGSHRYYIHTYDSLENEIDQGSGIVVTTFPTSLTTIVNGIAAIIFNGLPTGLLPGGTKKVFVSAETSLPSFCRYSLVPDVAYDDMPVAQTMKSANFKRLHFFTIDTEDDHAYRFYLRCFTQYGLAVNESDYPISFDVGVIPKEKRLPPPPPGTQQGNNTGGGNQLFQSGLTIDGKTFSGAQVSILKDGKEFSNIFADSQGNFSTQVTDLDRGTYSFSIIAIDQEKNRSTTYNTTLYMTAATRNAIGPVYMSPTVFSKTPRIEVGANVLVQGKAIPLETVQAIVIGAKDPLQQPYVIASTTANGSGNWSILLRTDYLPKGTYAVRAQTLVPEQGNSQFSPEFLVGIGVKPEGDNRKRSDLNGDGKVNLADLSILLFNWKKTNPVADINSDGIVSIIDFSIMLSAWTG